MLIEQYFGIWGAGKIVQNLLLHVLVYLRTHIFLEKTPKSIACTTARQGLKDSPFEVLQIRIFRAPRNLNCLNNVEERGPTRQPTSTHQATRPPTKWTNDGTPTNNKPWLVEEKTYPQNIRVAHKVVLCCMMLAAGVSSANVSGFQAL